MQMIDWNKTLQNVQKQYQGSIAENLFPKPWKPKGQLKAIVLGADPSNDKGDRFEHPFGLNDSELGEKKQDARYSFWLRQNLKALNISLNNILVQNVVPFYLKADTGKNKNWHQIASLCVSTLTQELDELDPSKRIPVLASCREVFELMAKDETILEETNTYYHQCKSLSPFETKIGREVIFFSRSRAYYLDNKGLEKYRDFVKSRLT